MVPGLCSAVRWLGAVSEELPQCLKATLTRFLQAFFSFEDPDEGVPSFLGGSNHLARRNMEHGREQHKELDLQGIHHWIHLKTLPRIS